MPTIAFCRQQQADCCDKLEREGWDEFTALGLSDWLHEELMLEADGIPREPGEGRP